MTRKLEDKLICDAIAAPEQLSAAEQAQLAASPGLQALLAENAALAAGDGRDCPPPPGRERLLSAVYAAESHTYQPKETTMIPNPLYRLFSGKAPALRFALGGLLLVALLALSLALPRGFHQGPAQPAWATADGYLLAFDFGDADLATIQPIIDQLKAKVTAFKQAHNLPTGQTHSGTLVASDKKMTVIRHEGSGPGPAGAGAQQEQQEKRAIVMVALPDATLVDDLKAELATIPGLPTPQLTDATWFTENGLPDPTQPGINLSLAFDDHQGGSKQHMFNFPEGATEQQIESEVNNWLTQNRPDCKFTVKVTLSGDEQNRKVEVNIQGTGGQEEDLILAPKAGN